MSEPTVEEAWAAMFGTPSMGRLATSDGAHNKRVVAAIKVAARALALAVLRATCAYPSATCAKYAKQSVVHAWHQQVLAEIEALGR